MNKAEQETDEDVKVHNVMIFYGKSRVFKPKAVNFFDVWTAVDSYFSEVFST